MKIILVMLLAMSGFARSTLADEMGASATYFDSHLDYSKQHDAEVTATIEDSADLDQPYQPNPDRFFVKFGPGWSSISHYGETTTEGAGNRRTSISVAVEYEHPLTSEFSLSTGLNYVEKGMDQLDSPARSVRLNYLILPLLAKFNFPVTERYGFALLVGPYVGYALRAAMYEYDQQGFFRPVDADKTSSIDFGTRFGLDYNLLIKSNFSFLVGAAYDLGLANIREDSPASQSTRAFQANIGLGLKI